MKHNEDKALAWIGLSEGGYVNHPKDPGGATDRGITQRTFDSWNRTHGRPIRPVRGISKEDAEDILVAQYFTPVWFNDLPDGIDYMVADYSVNSGPKRAVKDLQHELGFTGADVDGIMGVKTLDAVRQKNAKVLIEGYTERRLRFLKSLKTWATFGRGWESRVDAVEARALQMAAGRESTPVHIAQAPTGRATEDQEKETSKVAKAVTSPQAAAAGLLAGATPFVDVIRESVWIQITVSIVILGLGAWALMEARRKGKEA